MLVARRGLGPEEIRLVNPVFRTAVRWAVYAELLGNGLDELRAAVDQDPPDSLTGKARLDFQARRTQLRADLTSREAALYPADEATDG